MLCDVTLVLDGNYTARGASYDPLKYLLDNHCRFLYYSILSCKSEICKYAIINNICTNTFEREY